LRQPLARRKKQKTNFRRYMKVMCDKTLVSGPHRVGFCRKNVLTPCSRCHSSGHATGDGIVFLLFFGGEKTVAPTSVHTSRVQQEKEAEPSLSLMARARG
jgi:hypothetical protein